MLLRPLFFAAVFLGLNFAAAAGTLDAEQTIALLNRMADAKKDKPCLEANFHEVRKEKISLKPIESEGTLWLKLPNQFRQEKKGGTGESTSVSDGKVFWIYSPAFSKAEKYEIGPRFRGGLDMLFSGFDLRSIPKNYNVTAVEEPSGWTLTLKPKRADFKRMMDTLTLTMNKNFDVERIELTSKTSHVITTVSRHKSSPIPDSKFQFTPPEGTEIREVSEK